MADKETLIKGLTPFTGKLCFAKFFAEAKYLLYCFSMFICETTILKVGTEK